MARYINLADSKGRNAEIVFTSLARKPKVRMVGPDGAEPRSVRVLKGTALNGYEALVGRFGDAEKVAQALIQEDPDIHLEMTGRFVKGTSRVYIDQQCKPVFRVTKKEVVHAPDGSVKEERTPKELPANILSELPVMPSGKLFPRKEIYNKLVFAKKYHLGHVNGLTFDFLYEMAKNLHEKDALMMIGGGPKGTEPLVFQEGGKGYRAFLEGRIQGGKYLLLLHLSNLELKPLPAQ